jgi:CheY-like chemotaxis protein
MPPRSKVSWRAALCHSVRLREPNGCRSIAAEYRPDLILLDPHVPDMPGEQLFGLLYGEPTTRHIPVVVLSADATEHHIDQVHAAGAAVSLPNPSLGS